MAETSLSRRLTTLDAGFIYFERPDGNTPVIWKVHHAMVDGMSVVNLLMALHDLSPKPRPSEPAPPWNPPPLPDPLTLLQDAVRDQLTAAARRWTDERFRALRPPAP